jgi:hypothetical protein
MQLHREGEGKRPGLVVTQVIPVLFRVVKANFFSVGHQVKEGRPHGAQAFHPERGGPAGKKDLLAMEGPSRG